MKEKFQYLLNEKLNINGRNILCKVTGGPNSENDGQPYVLAITGGPGFDHSATEGYIRPLLAAAKKDKKPLPHFIFYDHLGCGKSDVAQDPEHEYTVDHFTDLAGDLVKTVKEKLNLNHMDLLVEGGSFGSLIAMNLPARKAEWLDPNSDINLKQITSKVTPNGAGETDYTFNFLQEHYSQHPNYEKIVQAQKKLYSGTIKDRVDYMQNFVLPISTLYIKDINKSKFNQFLQRLIGHFPNAVIKGLDVLNRFFKRVGYEIESLDFADNVLGKCSIDVLNHFFKTDFNGFNLIETVNKNQHLYQKIPICLISASADHVVDYKIAEAINQHIPHSSAVIIFDGPHMLSKGKNQTIYNQLNYDLFVTGHIASGDVNYPEIKKHNVTDQFNQLLHKAHQNPQPEPSTKQSTTILLAAMPEQLNLNSETLGARPIEPSKMEEKPSVINSIVNTTNDSEFTSTLVCKPGS